MEAALDSPPPVPVTALISPKYKLWAQVAAKHSGHATTPIEAAQAPASATHPYMLTTPYQSFRLPEDASPDNEGSHCLEILLSPCSPLTDYIPPSDNDGGGKATPPP